MVVKQHTDMERNNSVSHNNTKNVKKNKIAMHE